MDEVLGYSDTSCTMFQAQLDDFVALCATDDFDIHSEPQRVLAGSGLLHFFGVLRAAIRGGESERSPSFIADCLNLTERRVRELRDEGVLTEEEYQDEVADYLDACEGDREEREDD